MGKKYIKLYITKCTSKEIKKNYNMDFFIIDIAKIIKDLGYEPSDLTPESEFILNYSIRNKIKQGIYNTKCDSILICHKNMENDFEENLRDFLEDFLETHIYTIQNL